MKHSQKELLDLFGTVQWDGNLDKSREEEPIYYSINIDLDKWKNG